MPNPPSNPLPPMSHPKAPSPIGWQRPRSGLQGLTILAVEDSRFASDALRLMCRRLGARLRRAEDVASARAHLRTYRPDVVLVDLGLPDGRGEALIRDIILSGHRPAGVIGMSGMDSGRAAALASGADGFLDKPIDSLTTFMAAIHGCLPDLLPLAPAGGDQPITPDLLALQDDLVFAAQGMDSAHGDERRRRYLAGFLRGIAGIAHDPPLAEAARLGAEGEEGFVRLKTLVRDRLAGQSGHFAPG